MSVVAVSATPLYQQGFGPGRLRTRFIHMAGAPRVPLYQGGRARNGLGAASQIVGASAPFASMATTAAISSIASSGSAIGAAAGPIGAAVGVVVGLIAGLMAKHELRKKQATNENSAMNQGVSGWDSDIKQINAAYKAGGLSASDAMQAVQVAMQNFWQLVTPYIQPGRNGCNSGSSCPDLGTMHNQNPCTGSIGAACCVGCFDLQWAIGPELDGIQAAISGQSTNAGGKYVSRQPAVNSSQYGGLARGEYTLDWTPPAPSAAQSVTSSLTTAFGGDSSSIVPLLAVAVAAWAVLK